MRLMKLGSAAVLICAAFTLAACGDNGDDERRSPQINSPDSLTAASLGLPYSTTFMSRGNNIMWTVSSGSLPPGLTLDTTSGNYTGTPTTIGSYTFTIQASNDFGMDSRAFSQDVNLPTSDSNALLSNNRLAAFPMAFPAGFETTVNITGVAATDTLVSIDRRPQNGFLYALGYNAGGGHGSALLPLVDDLGGDADRHRSARSSPRTAHARSHRHGRLDRLRHRLQSDR